MLLNFITWNVDPVLFHLGPLAVRWYGLLWAIGIYATLIITQKLYKHENLNLEWVDKLFIYTVVGTILGARLGHCLFYEWDYYSANPIKILYIWQGGLASHGGAIGIVVAMYFFNRNVSKKGYIWIFDRLVIGVAICGAAIRLGNLMNSEIYGNATTVPWAFEFIRDSIINRDPMAIYSTLAKSGIIANNMIDKLPQAIGHLSEYSKITFGEMEDLLIQGHFIKSNQAGELANILISNKLMIKTASHPTQIYEILYCLLTFVVTWFLYWKKEAYKKNGLIFGVFLIGIFGSRFLLEFIKLNQVDFESSMFLNMGQILSLPFIAWGIWLIINSNKKTAAKA
jgi:prolipoprotein diacylglyceryl transferase